MRTRATPSYKFDQDDRVTWKGRHYRYVAKVKRNHTLVADEPDVAGVRHIQITDDEITAAGDGFDCDPGYYSALSVELRAVHGSRTIDDMPIERFARLHLRLKWATAFKSLEVAKGTDGGLVVNRTPAMLRVAIDRLRGPIQQWYTKTFAKEIKRKQILASAAVPGATTLYNIVVAYERGGVECLRDKWSNCGNRDQMRPEVRQILDEELPRFCSLSQPEPGAIVNRIHDRIEKLNLKRTEADRIPLLAPRLIRSRIAKLPPIFVRASRRGLDEALAAFAPVGFGVDAIRFGERLEMDDLEIDMHTLLCSLLERRNLPQDVLDRVPRLRCTVTAAIDCAVPVVAGINVAPHAPDAATAVACLRSACEPKTKLAKWAGCQSPWTMTTRWSVIATDGGSPFKSDTDETIREMTSGRKRPDPDPRMRGHVETFFGTFQKAFLPFYSGRTQAHVLLRGDYDSEEMASLVFEDLYKSIVRWCVDDYHNSPHTALENSTPAAAWLRMVSDDEGVPPPLPSSEITRIFGFRSQRTVDVDGITMKNLCYVSQETAWLHANRADRSVSVRVDPENLGSILVHVPLDVRDREIFGGREFVRVPCVQREAEGLLLVDWLSAQTEVREQHRRDVEAGTPARLAARDDLFEGGRKAMVEARIPTHAMTQARFDHFMSAMDRKSTAALSPPSARQSDLSGIEPMGTNVAPDQRFETTDTTNIVKRKATRSSRSRTPPSIAPASSRPLRPRYDNDSSDNKGGKK